ncbi:MAG: hypothetical protein ACYC9S_08730 [Leptospirales bacterium]
MPKLLIAGRGAIPLMAALLAEKRGYEPVVLLEEQPVVCSAILGGLPGLPLNYFFDTVGFPLGNSRFFHTISPSMIFLGETWQLLGVPEVRPGFSALEKTRWMSGFQAIQDSLLSELFRGMKQEMSRFMSPPDFWSGLFSWWHRYRFRRHEISLRNVLSANAPALLDWQPFLEALSPFLLLSTSSRNKVIPFRFLVALLNGWTSYPNDTFLYDEVLKVARQNLKKDVREWDHTPFTVRMEKRRKGVFIESNGKGELFDFLLDLSGGMEVSSEIERWEWTVPETVIPNVWPLELLIPSRNGVPPVLYQGRVDGERRIRYQVTVRRSESMEEWGSPLSSLDPLLLGGVPAEPPLCDLKPTGQMLLYSKDLPQNGWRMRAPYLVTMGPIQRMLDPTILPFLTDDWVRQLFYVLKFR